MKYGFKFADELRVGDVRSDGATVVKINRGFGRILVTLEHPDWKTVPGRVHGQTYRKWESVQVQN